MLCALPDRYCGLFLNCIDMTANSNIVYQSVQPFGFFVHTMTTDGTYTTSGTKGFCLNYNQIPC